MPDGNYQSSIFLHFSGTKKEETTNPEKTLEYIKHLTAMESRSTEIYIRRPMAKQQIKDYHRSIIVPIEIKSEELDIEAISRKQRQILEQLIIDTNLIKIDFFRVNKKQNSNNNTTFSLNVEYDYREVLELPEGHSNPDEQGNR